MYLGGSIQSGRSISFAAYLNSASSRGKFLRIFQLTSRGAGARNAAENHGVDIKPVLISGFDGVLKLLYRSGLHQIHGTAAEAAAGHARAIAALPADGGVHQEIHFVAGDLVIVLHAAVRFDESLAHAVAVTARRLPDKDLDAQILRDDVPGAPLTSPGMGVFRTCGEGGIAQGWRRPWQSTAMAHSCTRIR